ncbi:hypothetical protein GCM10011391_08530 [Pullulanibacillus camelliae]|uniref:DUF3813 domain-containing protein n=1 Tax=Pullulanibacillus camelliae TaxID=1707096 RepID=A0A8J2VM92_9BACL|nr:hypothetical protein [Pullulanibacillus camelliae]GGE32178.1 hypothetical protein GCM10011391_08530 [Pullulanibacillus camelliae]
MVDPQQKLKNRVAEALQSLQQAQNSQNPQQFYEAQRQLYLAEQTLQATLSETELENEALDAYKAQISQAQNVIEQQNFE